MCTNPIITLDTTDASANEINTSLVPSAFSLLNPPKTYPANLNQAPS